MKCDIQFFGVAGYKIRTSTGVTIVIDPFMEKNPYCPLSIEDLKEVDVLLVTHNAYDHFGDAPEIIREYRPVTICAMDVQHNLVKYHNIDPALIRPTIWGMEMMAKGIRIKPVESRHWSFCKTPDGGLLSGPAMGFIVDVGEGLKIYHPGDTALFSDMKLIGKSYGPSVGLMHVSLPSEEGVSLPHPEAYKTGELTPEEALLASEWLGLKQVVPSHYVDQECDDVRNFVRLVEQNRNHGKYAPEVHVLKPGDTYELVG